MHCHCHELLHTHRHKLLYKIHTTFSSGILSSVPVKGEKGTQNATDPISSTQPVVPEGRGTRQSLSDWMFLWDQYSTQNICLRPLWGWSDSSGKLPCGWLLGISWNNTHQSFQLCVVLSLFYGPQTVQLMNLIHEHTLHLYQQIHVPVCDASSVLLSVSCFSCPTVSLHLWLTTLLVAPWKRTCIKVHITCYSYRSRTTVLQKSFLHSMSVSLVGVCSHTRCLYIHHHMVVPIILSTVGILTHLTVNVVGVRCSETWEPVRIGVLMMCLVKKKTQNQWIFSVWRTMQAEYFDWKSKQRQLSI